MDNFHKFWDKINGEMYKDVPPPVKYDFAKYMDSISDGPVGNTEDGVYKLTPINWDDMASYAADDVADWYKKNGKNTTKLGLQMTDAEFKIHYGQTW